jgi:hypothetical protein
VTETVVVGEAVGVVDVLLADCRACRICEYRDFFVATFASAISGCVSGAICGGSECDRFSSVLPCCAALRFADALDDLGGGNTTDSLGEFAGDEAAELSTMTGGAGRRREPNPRADDELELAAA